MTKHDRFRKQVIEGLTQEVWIKERAGMSRKDAIAELTQEMVIMRNAIQEIIDMGPKALEKQVEQSEQERE